MNLMIIIHRPYTLVWYKPLNIPCLTINKNDLDDGTKEQYFKKGDASLIPLNGFAPLSDLIMPNNNINENIFKDIKKIENWDYTTHIYQIIQDKSQSRPCIISNLSDLDPIYQRMFQECTIEGKTPVNYIDDENRPFGILKPSDISFCTNGFGKEIINRLSISQKSDSEEEDEKNEKDEKNNHKYDIIASQHHSPVVLQQPPPQSHPPVALSSSSSQKQQQQQEQQQEMTKEKRKEELIHKNVIKNILPNRKRMKFSDVDFTVIEDDEIDEYSEYIDDNKKGKSDREDDEEDKDEEEEEEEEEENDFENRSDDEFRIDSGSEYEEEENSFDKKKKKKRKRRNHSKSKRGLIEPANDPPQLKYSLYDIVWDKIKKYPCIIVSLKDQNEKGISKYKSSKIEENKKIPVIYFCYEKNQFATIDYSITEEFTHRSILKYNQYERANRNEQSRYKMAVTTAFYCYGKAKGRDRLNYLLAHFTGCCRCFGDCIYEKVKFIYCDKCFLCYDHICAGYRTIPHSIEKETFYCYRCKEYFQKHPEDEKRERVIIHSNNNNLENENEDDNEDDDENDINQYLYNIYWDTRYATPCIVIDTPDMNKDALIDYNESFKKENYLPVLYFCEKRQPYGFAKRNGLEPFTYDSIFEYKNKPKSSKEMKNFASSVATAYFCQYSLEREYRLDCRDDKCKGCCKCFRKSINEDISSLLVCSCCFLYYHWKCENLDRSSSHNKNKNYVCSLCRARNANLSNINTVVSRNGI